MFDYALKNITKRLTRSLLTIIGIAIMTALVIVISGIVAYNKKTMHQHTSASVGKIIVQPALAGNNFPGSGVDLPEAFADSALNRKDIQQSISGKVVFFQIEPPRFPNEPPLVLLAGIEKGKEKSYIGSVTNETKVEQGVRSFDEVPAGIEYPVIIGMKAKQYYQDLMKKKLNVSDSIRILDIQFSIIGFLQNSPINAVNNSLIIPIDIAQKLLDKKGFITCIIIYPEKVNLRNIIINDLKTRSPQLNIITDETLFKNAADGIKSFETLVNSINIVIFAGTVILILVVMLITIKERTHEIGVLRAIGARTMLIIKSIIWEIFILSISGSILGGLISGFILRYCLVDNIFDFWHIFTYVHIAIPMTVISGIIPTVKILKIPPIESLRYE